VPVAALQARHAGDREVVGIFDVGIDGVEAQVLAHGQQVVKAVLELVAEAALDLREVVIGRVALIEVRDLAVGRVVEGRRSSGDRARNLGQDRQFRVLVGLPG